VQEPIVRKPKSCPRGLKIKISQLSRDPKVKRGKKQKTIMNRGKGNSLGGEKTVVVQPITTSTAQTDKGKGTEES